MPGHLKKEFQGGVGGRSGRTLNLKGGCPVSKWGKFGVLRVYLQQGGESLYTDQGHLAACWVNRWTDRTSEVGEVAPGHPAPLGASLTAGCGEQSLPFSLLPLMKVVKLNWLLWLVPRALMEEWCC